MSGIKQKFDDKEQQLSARLRVGLPEDRGSSYIDYIKKVKNQDIAYKTFYENYKKSARSRNLTRRKNNSIM